MSSRLQSYARFLYRDPHRRTNCKKPTETMVKRTKVTTKVTVQSAADIGKAKDTKDHGAWRYPGGVIKRATHLDTSKYHDHRDTELKLGRREIESNFFITINTNKQASGYLESVGKQMVHDTLLEMGKDRNICSFIKFGPKNPEYMNDKFDDVIKSVEWKPGSPEIGPNHGRLHAHLVLTIYHYSQLQVNMPMFQSLFKQEYNARVSAYPDLKITRRPYLQVKMLPTSDWAEVIRGYIHKSMADAPQHELHVSTSHSH